jgi:hypothetical protein
MPKTNADYQREHRDRRTRRLAQLETENAQLRVGLADALAELERLTASQCRHPAAAVDSGTCRACGTDVW